MHDQNEAELNGGLCHSCDECAEEWGRISAAEIAAENAWLRAAEYDPEAQDEMYREAGAW